MGNSEQKGISAKTRYLFKKTVFVSTTFLWENRKVSVYFLVGIKKIKANAYQFKILERNLVLKVFCELGTSVILRVRDICDVFSPRGVEVSATRSLARSQVLKGLVVGFRVEGVFWWFLGAVAFCSVPVGVEGFEVRPRWYIRNGFQPGHYVSDV